MTTIITAANAAHFLSLVPRLLGFRPRRSLVLVPFEAGRSLGTMRLDLPPDGAETERVASDLIGLVCRIADADGFALVAYADGPLHPPGEEGLPHSGLAAALSDRADACGLHVVHMLCVAEDAWGAYSEPHTTHDLDELDAMPAEGMPRPSRGDQTSGTRLPSVEAAERERVALALTGVRSATRLLRAGAAEGGDPRRVDPLAIAALDVLDDLPAFFEASLGWDTGSLDAYAAATLSWCLSQPPARDVGLLEWVGGREIGDRAVDAQLRWEAGHTYPTELGMRVWGEGPRPDPERLLRALALVRRIAAVTPRGSRAGALAVCGWLSWTLGRSTHADVYARRALKIDRWHGLARIIVALTAAGHLPDWAFRPAA